MYIYIFIYIHIYIYMYIYICVCVRAHYVRIFKLNKPLQYWLWQYHAIVKKTGLLQFSWPLLHDR